MSWLSELRRTHRVRTSFLERSRRRHLGRRESFDSAQTVRFFVLVAAALTVAAAAIGWILVDRLEQSIDTNAALAEEATELGIGSAEGATTLASDLTALTRAVEEGIGQLDTVALQTERTTAQIAEVGGGSLRNVVENTADSLAGLAETVKSLESALDSLSFLGVPQLSQGIADEIATAASELTPVPEELSAIASGLRDGSQRISELRTNLTDVRATLTQLTNDLEEVSAQLEPLPERVAEAQAEIREFRSSAGIDATLWHAVVIVVSLAFLAALAGVDRLGQRLSLTEAQRSGFVAETRSEFAERPPERATDRGR